MTLFSSSAFSPLFFFLFRLCGREEEETIEVNRAVLFFP